MSSGVVVMIVVVMVIVVVVVIVGVVVNVVVMVAVIVVVVKYSTEAVITFRRTTILVCTLTTIYTNLHN